MSQPYDPLDCSWNDDHANWAVTLHSSEEWDVYGKTLEEALVWLLDPSSALARSKCEVAFQPTP